jgi:hypothetical protein
MKAGKPGFFRVEGRNCRYDRPSNAEVGRFSGAIVDKAAMAQR